MFISDNSNASIYRSDRERHVAVFQIFLSRYIFQRNTNDFGHFSCAYWKMDLETMPKIRLENIRQCGDLSSDFT